MYTIFTIEIILYKISDICPLVCFHYRNAALEISKRKSLIHSYSVSVCCFIRDTLSRGLHTNGEPPVTHTHARARTHSRTYACTPRKSGLTERQYNLVPSDYRMRCHVNATKCQVSSILLVAVYYKRACLLLT
jgi:hypothetical protein